MARIFGPLRRLAALSVAFTLFAAPTAAAQSPEAAPPRDQPTRPALLSPVAFAKLVQGPRDGSAPVPVTKEPPRGDLLRQSTAAARGARAVSAQPPRRNSVGWGTKTLAVLALVGMAVGLLAISYYTGADLGDVNLLGGSGK